MFFKTNDPRPRLTQEQNRSTIPKTPRKVLSQDSILSMLSKKLKLVGYALFTLILYEREKWRNSRSSRENTVMFLLSS